MTRGPAKKFDPNVALSRAMEVFWAKGYEAASLSELLQHMGINKKSLYDTFGNKRSLFLKALEHYSQTVIKSIQSQLSMSGSPMVILKQQLRELQQTHGSPGSTGCMLGTNMADFCTDDEEIACLLRRYLTQLEDSLCLTLQKAQTAGELQTSAPPRDLARMLICLQQGMALVGRVLDSETLLKSAVEATTALLEQR